jgi:hypothetical protein
MYPVPLSVAGTPSGKFAFLGPETHGFGVSADVALDMPIFIVVKWVLWPGSGGRSIYRAYNGESH